MAQAVGDLLSWRLRSFRHGRTTPSTMHWARRGRTPRGSAAPVADHQGDFDGSLLTSQQRLCQRHFWPLGAGCV